MRGGVQATPLVVDGIMYLTGPWSTVYSIDARTGELLWQYDPDVPRLQGLKLCCGMINRGVALYEGKVYVGTLDVRLIALDNETGELLSAELLVPVNWASHDRHSHQRQKCPTQMISM
jgi:quinohemoprotein ethanol dehydrogenase